jgi:YtkA-like protein
MRKLLLAGAFLGALVFTAPASAGCWATVGLAPPPGTVGAGDVWTAQLTVLQHGVNPLPDAAKARPTVTIVNAATGQRRTFAAKATDPAAGTYAARVVFPSAGTWRYEVFDGFTSWGNEPAPCAQTHTFASVDIGGPGSGGPTASPPGAVTASEGSTFPIWPLAGGLGALLAAVSLAYFLRRRGPRVPASPA